ncbi:MAG: nucleotidyltransferase [Ignavibacteria bacterium]|nr:nucleotidyltransferase [Ignavibacteria bacterium]
MLNNDIIEKIQLFFATQPVEKVFLFGSYSRSEQNKDSDIDLLLEFNKEAKIGLIQFSRMKIEIEKVVNHSVDLLTYEALSKYIKPFIQEDMIKIYEKSN